MKVLVTGSAGFIGSHLLEQFIGDDEISLIRGVDNCSTGDIQNIESLKSKFDFQKGDLLDDRFRKDALADIHTVFHLAAFPSVPRSIENPFACHLNGAHLTLLLLADAAQSGVKRFVYSASSSAYGNSQELPNSEERKPDALSPYAATKLAGEHYCRAFSLCYEMDTCCLRYFNIFGPRQNPDSPYSGVLAKFCKAYVQGGEIVIHGDGEQSRDFTYVDNAVRANLLAMRSKKSLDGEVFNVGCGQRISLNGIVNTLNDLSGEKKTPKFGPDRKGDVKHSLADLTKIRKVLGYEPIVSFEEGLSRTLDWYRKNEGCG